MPELDTSFGGIARSSVVDYDARRRHKHHCSATPGKSGTAANQWLVSVSQQACIVCKESRLSNWMLSPISSATTRSDSQILNWYVRASRPAFVSATMTVSTDWSTCISVPPICAWGSRLGKLADPTMRSVTRPLAPARLLIDAHADVLLNDFRIVRTCAHVHGDRLCWGKPQNVYL